MTVLQHRWEERYGVDDFVSVKLLLPQRLAAIARLIDISPTGMAVSAPANLRRYLLITVQYEPEGGLACRVPALVVYRNADRLGLLLSLTKASAKRQHGKLLEGYRRHKLPHKPTEARQTKPVKITGNASGRR